MTLPDRDLLLLIRRRQEAKRDMQCAESLVWLGFDCGDALEEACLAYEEAANCVEDAKCNGI